jgi:hypothetical protein
MLCVNVNVLVFCSESLDFKGVKEESFDVIAYWLVTVIFKLSNTKGCDAVFKSLFCFVVAQKPDFLNRVVDYDYTT